MNISSHLFAHREEFTYPSENITLGTLLLTV